MSETRSRKDLSPALALLVLTGTAVSALPSSASAGDQGSFENRLSSEFAACGHVENDTQAQIEAKLNWARSLLREASKKAVMHEGGKEPTCAT